MQKKDFRQCSPEAQQEVRMKAVRAIVAGAPRKEVAALFGVTEQSLCAWMKRYRQGGERALASGKRGRPRQKSLKPWQCAQVVKAVCERTPDQLNMPFYLWTREAVGELIHRRFGVKLSRWTVGRYLASWGMTPQKPVRRAYERDDKAVKRWLEEDYPSLAARAKREGAAIHWGDEMGLRSGHQTGSSYSRRGETPAIEGTGKRFGCNMISTITNQGALSFMVFEGKFSSAVFLKFLRRLIKSAGRKVMLIVDGHPVHRSKAVKKWIQANEDRIEMHFLPGYSPELNPDELLNQDVKSNALGRRRPESKSQMMKETRGYLRSTQRQPHIVKGYFKEKHVNYAA